MSEEKKLTERYRCEECDDPCEVRFGLNTDKPDGCPFRNDPLVTNWKRVEQDQPEPEGETMYHSMANKHKKADAKEKQWKYKLMCGDSNPKIIAVDKETGSWEADMFFVAEDGILHACVDAKRALEESGYCTNGLMFDDDGAIVVGPAK